MIPLTYYLLGSIGLYLLGIYCLIVKRNMIRLLLALEILLNAVNLNFIVFARYGNQDFIDPLGHGFTMLSIGFGGCIIAVGLAMTLHAYRHYHTLDVRALRRLRH
jgi:NADH:ubiquinone oxidoreductase subunit K